MLIKYTLIISILLTCCKSTESTQKTDSYWKEVNIEKPNEDLPSQFISYELNKELLLSDLEENSKINLPLPQIGLKRIDVVNSGTISPELAKKFPNIKSYSIVSSENETIGSLDINNSGVYAMIHLNNITYFINPVTKKSTQYICYEKQFATKNLNNPFIDHVIKK